MTWPQYRRRECRYKDWPTPLTAQEADALLVLLLRGPKLTTIEILTDALWGGDPDGGVISPVGSFGQVLLRLRAKLPGAIAGRWGYGWYMKEAAPC